MSNYDDWKLETPEDERYRLNRLWKLPPPECKVCGAKEGLIECGGSWQIDFICEDCDEEEHRRQEQEEREAEEEYQQAIRDD